MNIEEIKEQLTTLPRKEQDEVIAFLFLLRQKGERDYPSTVTRRTLDTDSSHWLTPDEFERQLDRKTKR